jgi:hypothetical protein
MADRMPGRRIEGWSACSAAEAEAYLRVAHERYRLLRTHEWSDEIIARLRREIR